MHKGRDASHLRDGTPCFFLAIQSELELLPAMECPEQSVQETIHRCEKLYSRIDEIHKSTKTDELHLIDIDLKELIPKDEYGIFADTHDIARVDSLYVADFFEKEHKGQSQKVWGKVKKCKAKSKGSRAKLHCIKDGF